MEPLINNLRNKIPFLAETLGKFPGFAGIGIGLQRSSGELCWRLYVHSEMMDSALESTEWFGMPVEVITHSATYSCTYGNSKVDTLRPGVEISGDADGDGTLGCFAIRKGDPSKVVFLSNSHAIYKDAASYINMSSGTLDMGQPSISCSWCCKCRVIGEAKNSEAKKAFNHVRVKVDGVAEVQEGSEIDCAVADYNKKRNYTNEIENVGMITGAPPAGDLGVTAGSKIKKMGMSTGLTAGRVAAFTSNAKYENGTPISNLLNPFPMGNAANNAASGAQFSINQFFFIPDPDPNDPNAVVYFADLGDSGSVVVNDSLQVIAMISRAVKVTDQFRIDFNNQVDAPYKIGNNIGSVGVGMPIGLVLAALNIEIPPNLKGTATASGELVQVIENGVPREVKYDDWLSDKSDEIKSMISSNPIGKMLYSKVREHRSEVMRLINLKRSVTVTWHRLKGPAYVAAALRNLREPAYQIPNEIDGITRKRLIREMANVLSMHGSGALKNDIARALPCCTQFIDEVNSLRDLIQILEELSLKEQPLII